MFLCLVAWLVLVVAALASGGVDHNGGHTTPGHITAN